MASICIHCLKQPVGPRHRYYCSDKCQDAAGRTRRAKQVTDLRLRIATSGYDPVSKQLFAEAEETLLTAEHRAWHFRLMLDLVGGTPSRVKPNPQRPTKDYRCVTFPEPHRTSHLDCNGLRRKGDYFVLRSPFEWPMVPLTAYYRVQFLGFIDMGEPLELTNPTPPGLYVHLPASPFSDKWRSRNWGSEALPEHRLRQAQRRSDQKQARLEEQQRAVATAAGIGPTDPKGEKE